MTGYNKKQLVRVSTIKNLEKPGPNSTLANDLMYFAKTSGIHTVRGTCFRMNSEGFIFLENTLITPENSLILLNIENSFEVLLRANNFIADLYEISKEFVTNRIACYSYLKNKGYPVPEFTIAEELDYPFIVKPPSNKESGGVVKTEKEFLEYKEGHDNFICQKIIEGRSGANVIFRVYTYFYKTVAIIALIPVEKKVSLKINDKLILPVYPIRSFNLNTIKIPAMEEEKTFSYVSVSNKGWQYLTNPEKNIVRIVYAIYKIANAFQDKNVLFMKPLEQWEIKKLAEDVSKLFKLGNCSVDIMIDKDLNPYILDIYPDIQRYSEIPFHKLFSFQKKSYMVWNSCMKNKLFNLEEN